MSDVIGMGNVSDGFHTFDELYEHRFELYLALCRYVKAAGDWTVWKSRKHSDGSSFDGWFILGIAYSVDKQITYHLPDKYWDRAGSANELETAPPYDGHTPQDVLERLKTI